MKDFSITFFGRGVITIEGCISNREQADLLITVMETLRPLLKEVSETDKDAGTVREFRARG